MSTAPEVLVVARDCRALAVPAGTASILTAGSEVRVLQALGGSVTVRHANGRLYRIGPDDLDAVGMAAADVGGATAPDQPFTLDRVWDALRTVYDPEMSLNVVELGLIYRCEEVVRDGHRTVSIDMTMTAPGCGMGDVLRDDVVRVVGALPGVDDVDVTIVFDPPWCLDRIAEDVRLSLGLL
jgi:probable FeS assembly SUF system protein SufT